MPVVTVLYFAGLAQRIGSERESSELPDGHDERTLLTLLARRHPNAAELLARSRIAVDCRFAQGVVRVRAGDEVAVIPPVSGG